MPSRMWRKPLPSSPMSVSAGTSTPSRKTSEVAWLTIASVARIVTPGRSRRSMRKTDRPSARWAGSYGAVRASSSMRSECSAREVQALWPSMTQPSPRRSARVAIRVVSEPASRSVTPNACRRISPAAIAGSQRALLLLGPVPEQRAHRVHLRVARARAAARGVDLLEDDGRLLEPEAAAAVLGRDQDGEQAGRGHRRHERLRVAVGLEAAPVRARVLGAHLTHGGAQDRLVGGVGRGAHGGASWRFGVPRLLPAMMSGHDEDPVPARRPRRDPPGGRPRRRRRRVRRRVARAPPRAPGGACRRRRGRAHPSLPAPRRCRS